MNESMKLEMNLTIYRDPYLAEGTTLIYFCCIKVEILIHKKFI